MTREEAIKHFEAQTECNYAATREAAQMAVAALRAQQEQVGPLAIIDRLAEYEDTGMDQKEITNLLAQNLRFPLTLEELREMDGEPVFFKWNATEWFWALICRVTESGLYYVDASGHTEYAPYTMHGDGWMAYRRKPEEDGIDGRG